MESEFLEFNKEIGLLKRHYDFLITKRESLLHLVDTGKYDFSGRFSTNIPETDSTLSTIFISTNNRDFVKAKEEVALTNGLDSVFSKLFHKYDLIAQVYSNSASNVSRVYPSYDAQNLIAPDVDIREFNFYYEADQDNNPEKGPIWIPEAYVDPAGSGWILSLIQPVYDEEELFAVLGIDFLVNDFIHRYLEGEQGKLLIINGDGDIIGGKSSAIESLSMPPLKNHVYRETIKMDNFRISDFNLFNSKSKEVRRMAQSILFEKAEQFTFTNEKGLTKVHAVPFQILDWYLLELN
ncbi:MAG: Cache sensor protein [Algoriphagus sp.]|nr:Cache sensor protein [Algoriphagus sp.]